MKQVITVKLETTAEQSVSLIETMQAFNLGCDYVAEIAFKKRQANKIAIQPFVYGSLRADYGLSSQMAIRCIAKAIEAYKRDKNIQPTFAPHGAIVLDDRLMSFKGLSHVSLLTLQGRILVPMRYGAYQAARIDRAKGQADLILRDGVFYLYLTIDLPTPPPIEPVGVLGVDLGIIELASDSEGNQYSGAAVKAVRQRVKEHRRQLQKKNSRSAYKRLQKTRRRQSRFVRDTNHVISKQLVLRAVSQTKAIALEDLSGIRERASVLSRNMRWLMGNWAFDQLRQFIGYKCEAAGIPLILIDPRNTSRTCSACGHCDKANRKSQSKFECLNCGFSVNADKNAALNISRKGTEARAKMSDSLMFHSNPALIA
jgi:putative transposase